MRPVSKPRVSSSVLDRVYNNWSGHRSDSYIRTYQRSYRFSRTNQLFEDWLYQQGGRVIQINHQRTIEFETVDQMMVFVLVWG